MPCADIRLIGRQLSEIPVGTLLVLKDSLNNLATLCDVITSSRSLNANDLVIWVKGGVTLKQGIAGTNVRTFRYSN